MQVSDKYIKSCLINFSEGHQNVNEITSLVHCCRAIAETYLYVRKKSLFHVQFLNGLTIEDLATDCIADIFARNDKLQYFKLDSFLHSLPTSVEQISDKELFYYFRAFVMKIVNSHLARLFTQSDPLGAKILRNIKNAIKNSNVFELHMSVLGVLLKPSNCKDLDHLPFFPSESLESELLSHPEIKTSVPRLIEATYSVLTSQDKFRKSVPLIEFVKIYKNLYNNGMFFLSDAENTTENHVFESVDAEYISHELKKFIKEKIVTTYLFPKKINIQEANALFFMMNDIVTDWFSGDGDSISLFERLKIYMPISQDKFDSVWRMRTEYLKKLLREHASDLMVGEL